MSNYFYDLPTTSKRRNKYVHPSLTGPNGLRVHSLVDLDLPQGFVYYGAWAQRRRDEPTVSDSVSLHSGVHEVDPTVGLDYWGLRDARGD